MRLRYMAFAVAAIIAVLALQHGTATKSGLSAGHTMNVMEMQLVAGKNLPELVIAQSY